MMMTLASAAENVIGSSSDLSSALPPGQWSEIEQAVDQGLAWLADSQQDDGRFPGLPSTQPAMTSFAVMAFLSRGHMPGQGRYGGQLNRAIDYVLSTQNRRGIFSRLRVAPTGEKHPPSQTAIYNHMIAGLMLGEVYGMTRGPRSSEIRHAMERALVYARSVQARKKKLPADQGGFRYAYPENGNTSDLSVTGWALMFLRSARNAEFDVPKSYLDEALDFVETCYVADPQRHEDGVFNYRSAESKEDNVTLANTGSGMLSLLLGGRHKHESIAVGAKWYRARPYPKTSDHTPRFYLATYYSSQALAQVGGETWNQVFPQLAQNLLEAQTSGGGWPTGRGGEANLGPTFSTSLSILSLTPAFQLLPIYQR